MPMRHQHRRRHSFARHIAESKTERVGSCRNQIDIVAAYESSGFVGKGYLPVAKAAAPVRKQAQLDLPGQFQLSLQSDVGLKGDGHSAAVGAQQVGPQQAVWAILTGFTA